MKYSYETGGEKRVNTEREGFLFKCKRCGHSFCVNHRLPEKHECPVSYEEFKSRQKSKVDYDPYEVVQPILRRNYPVNSKSDEARISYRTPTPSTQINEIYNPSRRNWILNNKILLLMILVILIAIVYYLFI